MLCLLLILLILHVYVVISVLHKIA